MDGVRARPVTWMQRGRGHDWRRWCGWHGRYAFRRREREAGGAGGSQPPVAPCESNVCPCSEAGIRGAVAEGGGPFTFDCFNKQIVVTQETIEIDKDVILDAEGQLTVSGGNDHRVFETRAVVTLTGFEVADGFADDGGGILNSGTLTIIGSRVFGNTATRGGGISSVGRLIVERSIVSFNSALRAGGAIAGSGDLVMAFTEISRNLSQGFIGGCELAFGDTCGFDTRRCAAAVAWGRGGSVQIEDSLIWGETGLLPTDPAPPFVLAGSGILTGPRH